MRPPDRQKRRRPAQGGENDKTRTATQDGTNGSSIRQPDNVFRLPENPTWKIRCSIDMTSAADHVLAHDEPLGVTCRPHGHVIMLTPATWQSGPASPKPVDTITRPGGTVVVYDLPLDMVESIQGPVPG